MSSRRPIARWFAAAAALCLGLAACADDGGVTPPFVDPPPLPTAGVTWLNADPPPTLEGLKGQVVFLEFGWFH